VTGLPEDSFAVAITCIDGRIQEAIRQRLRDEYGVDHLDVVTVPGADAAIATDESARAFVRRGVDVSVRAHGSRVVILAGHTDCAGNPVDVSTHVDQVRSGTAWLCAHYPGLTVSGVLVDTGTGSVRVVTDPRICAGAHGPA
jgi:carbonic anhydrase